MRTNLRIGDILTEKGYVTEAQMSQALAYQKEHRDKRVGQILMELGFVTENQVLEALASRLNLKLYCTVDGGYRCGCTCKQRCGRKESDIAGFTQKSDTCYCNQ